MELSRNEKIIEAILSGDMSKVEKPRSRIEALLIRLGNLILSGGGGSGGGGGSSVSIDTTLTKAGSAADAAEVGRRLGGCTLSVEDGKLIIEFDDGGGIDNG